MSTETNKAVCRRMLETLYNEQRSDRISEFFTADTLAHVAGMPDPPPGYDFITQSLVDSYAAFPDIHISVDDEIAEGDQVVFRWTMTATHEGEMMGIPPTGKEVTRLGCGIYRLDGDKIAEVWFYADNLDFMQQLGAIPASS
jgi:predicted ester cyclase